MGSPEKDPENKAEPKPKESPKLDAILPDDLPTAAAELVGDIDSYQKRMEQEWETTKSSYEQKINRIMEEFLDTSKQSAPEPEPIPPPPRATNKPKMADERLRELMGQLEQELRRGAPASKRIPHFSKPRPQTMQLGWSGASQRFSRKTIGAVAAACVGVALLMAGLTQRVVVQTLPYAHTLGPIASKGNIYVMDWFRRSLYVHADKAGLPILAIESLPNTLATGMAMSDKTLWTLDGMDHKILLHTLTPDHQVMSSVSTPEKNPAGLFFDGTDLWSTDQQAKTLYRHRGNDLEDIRDSFPLPDITVTGLAFINNRLWLLDGKTRLMNVYRLQKPLLQLGSFDLDPFVKTATPTGFAGVGRQIWLVTENPSQLIRIPSPACENQKRKASNRMERFAGY